MQSLRGGGLCLAFLAAVGCTPSGPADEAQLAVPKAIDCDRLGATVQVEADASGDFGPRAAPVGPPLHVRLKELRAVSPALTPGRKEKSEDRFAGLVPFRVEGSGTYTLLVASLAWADVGAVSPSRPIQPRSFEWLTLCGKKFKSGLYGLERGKAYFVQLWDSPDRELTLMIRRLP
jgi:hypothetical protein